MASAASPHAADGERGKRRPPPAGVVVARLALAAAAVLVVQTQARQRSRVREASAPTVAPATPAAKPGAARAMLARVVVMLFVATAAAASLGWRRASMLLPLQLLLLLLLLLRRRKQLFGGAHTHLPVTLTEFVPGSQADGEPAIEVSRCGRTTHVTASVAVRSSSKQLWGVVRACLNGESVGILRDVRHAEVLDRPAPGVCLLAQRVAWRAGVMRGENHMRAQVHTDDAARSLRFVQLSDDPIMRTYSGRLSVHGTGPQTSELRMQQLAEGQRSIVAHIAGATVLGATLRSQTRSMLLDFKRAAESAS